MADENFEDLSSTEEDVPEQEQPEDQTEGEEQQDEPEAPAEPEKPEGDKGAKQVPYAALAEERGKRQALEQMILSLQQGQGNQAQQQPEKIPDMFQDPEAYTRFFHEQLESRSQNARLDLSEEMAREKYGDEAADAALAAARAAGVTQQFLTKRHPWGELIKWHQQQAAAQEIGDPVAFREKLRAEILAELQADQAAKQIKSAPPSMANETSIGGRTPTAANFTKLDDLLPD